jgi:superfamily II DNA or RNA helicase
MSYEYYYYQQEADDAICKELESNDKCIVKMFCGTGKSKVMRECKINENKNLVVYVFPTLQLIVQFTENYLANYPKEQLICVSSEMGSI